MENKLAWKPFVLGLIVGAVVAYLILAAMPAAGVPEELAILDIVKQCLSFKDSTDVGDCIRSLVVPVR